MLTRLPLNFVPAHTGSNSNLEIGLLALSKWKPFFLYLEIKMQVRASYRTIGWEVGGDFTM